MKVVTMEIVLPLTDDRDKLGYALYDALIAASLPDLAARCSAAVRTQRDIGKGWDDVLALTRDAEIKFRFRTSERG